MELNFIVKSYRVRLLLVNLLLMLQQMLLLKLDVPPNFLLIFSLDILQVVFPLVLHFASVKELREIVKFFIEITSETTNRLPFWARLLKKLRFCVVYLPERKFIQAIWFNVNTVYIEVLNAAKSASELILKVFQVFLHELVLHQALQNLVGSRPINIIGQEVHRLLIEVLNYFLDLHKLVEVRSTEHHINMALWVHVDRNIPIAILNLRASFVL